MAVTDTPVFGQTPQNHTVVVTSAYDNLDDDTPTNTSVLVTAGTDGALVKRITAVNRSNGVAATLGLFFTPDSGTTIRFLGDILVGTHTISTTAKNPVYDFKNSDLNITPENPMMLQGGEHLRVGISVASTNGWVFWAEWVDL